MTQWTQALLGYHYWLTDGVYESGPLVLRCRGGFWEVFLEGPRYQIYAFGRSIPALEQNLQRVYDGLRERAGKPCTVTPKDVHAGDGWWGYTLRGRAFRSALRAFKKELLCTT